MNKVCAGFILPEKVKKSQLQTKVSDSITNSVKVPKDPEIATTKM